MLSQNKRLESPTEWTSDELSRFVFLRGRRVFLLFLFVRRVTIVAWRRNTSECISLMLRCFFSSLLTSRRERKLFRLVGPFRTITRYTRTRSTCNNRIKINDSVTFIDVIKTRAITHTSAFDCSWRLAHQNWIEFDRCWYSKSVLRRVSIERQHFMGERTSPEKTSIGIRSVCTRQDESVCKMNVVTLRWMNDVTLFGFRLRRSSLFLDVLSSSELWTNDLWSTRAHLCLFLRNIWSSHLFRDRSCRLKNRIESIFERI